MKFPVFYENSKMPVLLSKVAPIKVWAFSFAFWVFCRGEMSDRTKNHETIHYVQQREMLFVLQWIAYAIFWLIGYAKKRNGTSAYYENPFEKEAYDNDNDLEYLQKRKHYAWTDYIWNGNVKDPKES